MLLKAQETLLKQQQTVQETPMVQETLPPQRIARKTAKHLETAILQEF